MYDNLEYMRNKKTVVITGGNRGIGLGITKVFLKNNYIVIVGSRSPIVEDLNNFKNSIIHLKIDVKKDFKNNIIYVNKVKNREEKKNKH